MFSKPLKLTKTHDICPSKQPKLTVVFVHGIAGDWTSFKNAAEYLEGTTSMRDIRFVAFDLLGSGKSLKSDKLNYGYKDQLTALENSLADLKLDTPLVLVGHSMGCLIVSRFADSHKRMVKELILISPPIYRPSDFENPAFLAGQEGFKKIIIQKDPHYKNDKAFNNELQKIVFDKKNYDFYLRLTKPTTIIYGLADQIIASFNIPGLLRANKKIVAIETPGAHGVSRDKYTKLIPILERIVNETV